MKIFITTIAILMFATVTTNNSPKRKEPEAIKTFQKNVDTFLNTSDRREAEIKKIMEDYQLVAKENTNR